MPASITIDIEQIDAGRVYAVGGEMDLATVPQLEDRLDFGGPGSLVVLDLTAVAFIDSTGLRTIVAAHEDAEDAGKHLRIVVGDKARRLLDITGLSGRLAVYEDRAAAVEDG